MSQNPTERHGSRRWTLAHEEILVSLLLLGLFTFLFFRIDTFVLGRRGTYLDPTFWPQLLLGLGALFSVGYLIHAIRDLRQERRVETASEDKARVTETETATATSTTETTDTDVVDDDRSTDTAAGPEREETSGEPAPPPAEAYRGDDIPDASSDDDHEADERATGIDVLKTVGGALLVALYIWLMRPIGFIPATVVFCVLFLLLVGERRWWMLLLFPIGASALVILVFTQLLTVALPRGSGIFLTLSTYLY